MDAALVTAKPETLDQLMTQIEQQHASMPKRLREIGNFVLGHPEAIALSTLAELASETEIATSAFVRFAQTLGFDGFSQMQALFRQQVRSSWPQYARAGFRIWRMSVRQTISRRCRCLPLNQSTGCRIPFPWSNSTPLCRS